MSPANAEAVVRQYIERVWNRGDVASLDALTTTDFTYHLAAQPPRNHQQFAQFVQLTRVAFPDWRIEIDEMIVGPQAIAVRWSGHATHLGPFRGIQPTGRTISVSGINTYTIRDGRIAVEWEQTDSMGMLQQLGVLPQ